MFLSTPPLHPTSNEVGFGQKTVSIKKFIYFLYVKRNNGSMEVIYINLLLLLLMSISSLSFSICYLHIQSSLTTPQPVQAAQTDGTSNTNFGQTSAGVTNVLGQGTSGQLSTTQDAEVVQSSPVVNPFGTLAAMPQTSIVRHRSTVIQYGISSMPVADNPVPAIVSSLLTSRHLSKRQFKLQA